MERLHRWLLLLVLLAPGFAGAETLRLVADPWPPFTDQTLLNNGLATDLVETALSRAGYATNYTEVPWARAVRGLQNAEYDVVASAWFSEARATFGYFSQPYLVNRIRFLRRKGSAIDYRTLSDLYPYRIAVMRGYAYSSEFSSDPNLTKIEVGSFESGARMLQRQRVDLVLEDEFVANYHFGRSLQKIADELEFVPLALRENGLHILIRRTHPEHQLIAERFNQAIAAMRADGSYAQILKRHGF